MATPAEQRQHSAAEAAAAADATPATASPRHAPSPKHHGARVQVGRHAPGHHRRAADGKRKGGAKDGSRGAAARSGEGKAEDEDWESVEEGEEDNEAAAEPAAESARAPAEAEAAGGGAPEVYVERRVDRSDGHWYTEAEFAACYGSGGGAWDAAPRCEEVRVDPADGLGYAFRDFKAAYGDEGLAKWCQAEVVPVARIGVVLDLHYLEIAAKQFSLKTSWDPTALEVALERILSGMVSARIAADSSPIATSHDPGQEKWVSGKQRLHERLEKCDYDLRISPGKRVVRGAAPVQGATDVDICVAVNRLAGAFADAPQVDVICLIAGDSDFRPLMEAVLEARHESVGLRCAVVAIGNTLRHEYREWLVSTAGVEFVELTEVLQCVAPHVVNMRAPAHPDPEAAAEALKRALRATKRADGASAPSTVTLELSGHRQKWGDGDMSRLGSLMAGAFQEDPALCGFFGELWVHHTDISDQVCMPGGVLHKLVSACAHLREVHLSDTQVTAKGTLALAKAAAESRQGAKGPSKLYINAEHVSVGEFAAAYARDVQETTPPTLRPVRGVIAGRSCSYFAPGDLGKLVNIKLCQGGERRGQPPTASHAEGKGAKGKGEGKGAKDGKGYGKGRANGVQYQQGKGPAPTAAKGAVGKGGKGGAKGKGRGGGGEVVLRLAIPIARCGLLIGKGGSTFKELQQRYGVTLEVPKMGAREGELTIIRGPREDAMACKADIFRKVHGECREV
eukprot:TRINITY_DN11531_c0_g1_i1.p1 TRINITY_DN11531_c0_g1~~TRINITY_DN11531_c0_g1_i1.p1  ORF type:complete len:763 (+),score=176.92 TRINITY_DN11531_c0_g1_i1:79-2289(+)